MNLIDIKTTKIILIVLVITGSEKQSRNQRKGVGNEEEARNR